MEIKSFKEIVNDQLSNGAKAAADKYKTTIRPIYGTEDGKPIHIGTCFFVEYKEKKYLITAAHVIDESKNTTLWLAVEKKFIPLEGTFYTTLNQANSREDDHYDFAWFHITEELFSKVGNIGLILEKDISPNQVDPKNRVYVAMGYPCSKNKVSKYTKNVRIRFAYYFSTWKEMKSLYKSLKLSGSDHIAIDHAKQSKDEHGKIVNSFHPRGMSGGALIDLGNMVTLEELARETVFSGLLAGVLIEKHKQHNAILSVKINLVLESIDKHAES